MKMRRTGTRKRFSFEIPSVPRSAKKKATMSPTAERSGEHAGRRESSPASIPAAEIKEQMRKSAFMTALPLPKRRSVPPNPPRLFPANRKRTMRKKKRTKEKRRDKRGEPVPKNRTSSAPVINPAPIVPPMTKNAPLTIPIPSIYAKSPKIMKNLTNFQKLCLT